MKLLAHPFVGSLEKTGERREQDHLLSASERIPGSLATPHPRSPWLAYRDQVIATSYGTLENTTLHPTICKEVAVGCRGRREKVVLNSFNMQTALEQK